MSDLPPSVQATCPACGAQMTYTGRTAAEIRADPARSRCAACDVAFILRERDGTYYRGEGAPTSSPEATRWNARNRERSPLPADQAHKGDRLLRDALGGLA